MRNYIIEKIKEKVFYKKRGGKEIFMELGLAIVGVVLLMVFRDQIKPLVSTIANFVSSKIQSIFSGM